MLERRGIFGVVLGPGSTAAVKVGGNASVEVAEEVAGSKELLKVSVTLSLLPFRLRLPFLRGLSSGSFFSCDKSFLKTS